MTADPTPKQTRFVEEYLVDRNGTQAAIRAGYSRRSAAEIAYELLSKPQIASLIRNKARALAEELTVTRRKAVEQLIEAAEHAKAAGDAWAMIVAWREIASLLDLYPTCEARTRRRGGVPGARGSVRDPAGR